MIKINVVEKKTGKVIETKEFENESDSKYFKKYFYSQGNTKDYSLKQSVVQ